MLALGYERAATPRTIGARVGAAMLFAIETGMRAGEIAALEWPCVHLDRRMLRITGGKGAGKTDAAIRDVPLSPEALRILRQMEGDGSVFGLTPAQIDSNYRKARRMAMVEGLTFHDLRHTAITRLAKKLDVLDLARMVGHRDLKQLMVYYNESAENLAKML